MNTSPRKTLTLVFALMVIGAVIFSGCTNNTPSDDWELSNQNEKNTRYAGGRISTSTIESLGVAWTADVKAATGVGAGAPNPLISHEAVFVETSGGVEAFNRYTGDPAPAAAKIGQTALSPKWFARKVQNATSKLGLENAPILSNTNVNDPEDGTPIVVNTSPKGEVVALDAETGGKVWSRQIESVGDTSPRVISNMAAANNAIFAPVVNVPEDAAESSLASTLGAVAEEGGVSGSLVSINADNGDVNWTKKLASAPLGGATVANNIVFVTTVNGNVYGFNRDSGDQVWTSALPAGSATPIAASDDTLIVPASLVTKRGQKAQVVAFRIGGLGEIGGVEAPKLKQQQEGERAEKTEATEGEEAGAGAVDAKALFSQNCGGCHTLSDAGTAGTVGPNLDTIGDDAAAVQKQIENGGGGMPPFKGTLSPEEIKALAAYVASVDGS